jgi:hypothetical protein
MILSKFKNNLKFEKYIPGDRIHPDYNLIIKFDCFVQLYNSDKFVKVVLSHQTWLHSTLTRNRIFNYFTKYVFDELSKVILLHKEGMQCISPENMSMYARRKIITKEQIQILGRVVYGRK